MKTKLLLIIGISIFGLLSLGGEKNDVFGWCVPGTDWSDKPCYGCPYCYPGLEQEKLDWAPYYDFKGKEFMELKKQEMNLAIQNDTLSDWIELTSETQAHHNVYKYYFLQGEVLRDGMTFSESIEYNKVWNAKSDIHAGPAIVISVTPEAPRLESESLNKKWGELYLEYQLLKESLYTDSTNMTTIERMAEIDDETMLIAAFLSEREFTIDIPEMSIRNVTFDDSDYSEPYLEIDPEPEEPTISDEQLQMIREYCETGIRHPDMMGIPQCVKEPDWQLYPGECERDAYGNFYGCLPQYDPWKKLFSSPIALLVVFGTLGLIIGIPIVVIYVWRKRK